MLCFFFAVVVVIVATLFLIAVTYLALEIKHFLLSKSQIWFPSKFSLNEIRENDLTKFILGEIFDLIFKKKFHFREIFVQFSFDKNKIFPFPINKIVIVFLRRKNIFKRKVENLNEFREKNLTKSVALVQIFVGCFRERD